jgi:hypothetical protein
MVGDRGHGVSEFVAFQLVARHCFGRSYGGFGSGGPGSRLNCGVSKGFLGAGKKSQHTCGFSRFSLLLTYGLQRL